MIVPIAFHLPHQPNPKTIADRYGNSPLRAVVVLQHQLFQLLLLLLREPITLSLRYLYDPHASADQRLQIFLIFNTELSHSPEREQLELRLTSALQSSEFYQIYPFQLIPPNTNQFPTLQNLDWVHAISEIQKAETISPKGYYLPRLFPENPDNDMVKICEQLSRIKEQFLLEITLQLYNNPSERTKSLNALEAILKAHSKASNSAKDAILETVIKSTQNHQTNYSHKPLFTYSIKLLAEQEHSLSNLAISWLQNATNSDYTSQCHPPILTRGSTEFQQSLQATRQVRVAPLSYQHSTALQNWHQEFGNQTVSKVFRDRANSIFGDGSTAYSNPTPPPQLPAGYSLPNANSTSGSLVSGGSSGLSKAIQGWTTSQPALMQDLLPLRHLATLDEISSFLRVVIPDKKLTGMAIAQTSYPTMTAEQIFDKYRHLITHDTYIVGLDDQGEPVISSWDNVPHRLLAGVPGAGKTNFLRWLLFQFLYVNPKRKVYITDFKGLDFQFLQDLRTYADISITIESCQVQVATIQNEEFLMRQQIMLKYKVTKLSALRKELQKHNEEEVDRTLWLIDEAADISFASNKVRTEIENSLTKYARQGRSYGIQVVYCTQRVSSAVITPQVTDQCEEKVIFRVGSAASTIVLEDAIASEIPMNAIGRAVLDSPQGRFFINTPLMKSPEGSEIPISATLWKHLQQ